MRAKLDLGVATSMQGSSIDSQRKVERKSEANSQELVRLQDEFLG